VRAGQLPGADHRTRAQTESQGMPSGHAKSGATAATQKTIGKMADMYKTQMEKIQTEK
jgi:hypothetical protein